MKKTRFQFSLVALLALFVLFGAFSSKPAKAAEIYTGNSAYFRPRRCSASISFATNWASASPLPVGMTRSFSPFPESVQRFFPRRPVLLPIRAFAHLAAAVYQQARIVPAFGQSQRRDALHLFVYLLYRRHALLSPFISSSISFASSVPSGTPRRRRGSLAFCHAA